MSDSHPITNRPIVLAIATTATKKAAALEPAQIETSFGDWVQAAAMFVTAAPKSPMNIHAVIKQKKIM